MKRSTERVYAICTGVGAHLNSFTNERNFKFRTFGEAVSALNARYGKAISDLVSAGKIAETKAARDRISEYYVYIHERYGELFDFIESVYLGGDE